MKKALKVIGAVFAVIVLLIVGTSTVLLAKVEEEEKMYNADY